MRLFRRFYFAIPKKEKPEDVANRIQRVINSVGGSYSVQFYMNDHDSLLRSVSAVKRVIKKFPEMAEFFYTMNKNSVDEVNVLSNYNEDWGFEAYQNPNNQTSDVDIKILVDIITGIPRTFPFAMAAMIFKDLCIPGTIQNDVIPNFKGQKPLLHNTYYPFLSNSIQYINSWGYSSRIQYIHVIMEVPVPDSYSLILPAITPTAHEFLDVLGKFKSEDVVATPSPEEEMNLLLREEEAKKLIDNWRDSEYYQKIISLTTCRIPRIKALIGILGRVKTV